MAVVGFCGPSRTEKQPAMPFNNALSFSPVAKTKQSYSQMPRATESTSTVNTAKSYQLYIHNPTILEPPWKESLQQKVHYNHFRRPSGLSQMKEFLAPLYIVSFSLPTLSTGDMTRFVGEGSLGRRFSAH